MIRIIGAAHHRGDKPQMNEHLGYAGVENHHSAEVRPVYIGF
jgi:hypothetical protein